jgi:lia operon protein LiaG
MKKISLLLLLVISFSFVLSGCIVTDNDSDNDYERNEFKSKETVSKIVVSDESTDVLFQISDSEEMSVKYSDSSKKQVYDISVSNGILEIEKTKSTVGVDDTSLVISLPDKEYEEISVNTTNGDIIFENVSSMVYRCDTENGDIKGTILGSMADYSCTVSVKNGDSTIDNNDINSTKTLEFNVKNGDVKVEFAQ